jgi:hypothetical protein
VTPFGEIVATHHRGDLMGNRGCLHDDHGNIVRHSDRQAWIACLPSWPGVRRTIMAPGRYTELFFLDEATTLAAGHRPCGECRRERLEAFKAAWAKAHGLGHLPRVAEIDAVLGEQRGQRRPIVNAATVPAGAMVTPPGLGRSWLRWQGEWLQWSLDAYQRSAAVPSGAVELITPAATAATLAAGYVPEVRFPDHSLADV